MRRNIAINTDIKVYITHISRDNMYVYINMYV